MLAHARTVVCARAHAIALADALTRAHTLALVQTAPSVPLSLVQVGVQQRSARSSPPLAGEDYAGKGEAGNPSQVTMTKGGGISPQLYVPQEVWLQEGAKCVDNSSPDFVCR
jgi:hypothetical protein